MIPGLIFTMELTINHYNNENLSLPTAPPPFANIPANYRQHDTLTQGASSCLVAGIVIFIICLSN